MRRPISYGKRTLTEEEQRLWQHVTQGDAPLPEPKAAVAPQAPGRIRINRAMESPRIDISRFPVAAAPVSVGAYAGVDRNTADRFRKGQYPIDATLDLHGMSREKAHMALSGFIHAHCAMGNRCLLVVTGKGTAPGGVLRELLPHWLDEPGLKPFVLALDVAKGHHGGSGAYYILLRRKR